MRSAAALLLSTLLCAQQPDVPTFRASANLVIVTVFVKDKDGQPVRGLTKDDFVVLEAGKPQTISVFEFQEVENSSATEASIAAEADPAVAAPAAARVVTPQPGAVRFRDKRLLVMFFDWSSMQPPEQIRAREAAQAFVRTKMTSSDLVMVATFSTRLKVEQEFTADRDALLALFDKFLPGEDAGLATEGSTEEDTSEDSMFTADESEFNMFNTDRKLAALEDTAKSLQALPEKKALIYFSSGVSRTGVENQSQLRATTNAAVRANLSFFPVDVRGLTAEPPGGGVQTASMPRGNALFSGSAQNRQRSRQLGSQETLTNLADETGGKALLDTNDLEAGITQAQQAIRSYYVVGYYSTDDRRDGRFRRVQVRLSDAARNRTRASLDYRQGYYAEKDFKEFTSSDKEKQLQDALLLGDPITDLPLALEVDWFRVPSGKYFVPVVVKLPGSAVPLKKQGGAETTEFDFVGQVRDSRNVAVAAVRDNIKIKLREKDAAGSAASRNLVYDTGFTLAPGDYSLKMLVRENLTGKIGTFETRFNIPDLAASKDAPKLSSVVWGTQLIPAGETVGAAGKSAVKQAARHPLVWENQKLLPSVTRAFRPGQTLHAFAEVYEAAKTQNTEKPAIAAQVTLYDKTKLVASSKPFETADWKNPKLASASVRLELPLNGISPGDYVAQLTVIDKAGKSFAFSRAPVVVLPAPAAAK
jgi:VWFA-related protein